MLNRLAAGSDAGWIAVADGSMKPSASDLERLLAAIDADQSAGCAVLPLSPLPELRRSWEWYPPQLSAVLCRPEAENLLAFRRSAVANPDGFRDVDAPVWDRLIRASAENGRMIVLDSPQQPEEDACVDAASLPLLAPEPPDNARDWLYEHLSDFDVADLLADVISREDALALQAGLYQLHDYLDVSHNLSQQLEGRGRHNAGDYWHAIMHRREPDYSNSKYWFRRVGDHPVYEALARRAAAVFSRCDSRDAPQWRRRVAASGGWDPIAFIELCAHLSRSDDEPLTVAARTIQFIEMLLLMEQTYEDARS